MATIVFGSIIWGAAINRFQLQVNNVDIEISDLPDSFNGYRIAQISDLHVGTFGNDTTFVSKMVDRINALDCNLVVFTGDIVNQHTQELRPFVKTLRRITPPDGVISILGNHDYGDYYKWASDTDKEVNMQALLDKQIDMGWELLTNNSTTIFSDVPSDSIVIIGVENWGDPPFSQLGDLRAAYPNLSDSATKILLTHNPMHWKSEVENNDSCNIHLTLSGHTHAMQVNIAGISPAAIRYPKCWAGRHVSADGKRTLYVNTGIGTVGLPMRIGATPEITVFTLKNNKR
jgi:predicted MPP superfamily phosphohydrolase